MLPILVTTLVLHGALSLIWIAGLRRFAAPVSARLWCQLLALALVLPPALGLARALGLPGPGEAWAVLRADLWADAFTAHPALAWASGLLLGGTAVLFLVQELRPALGQRGVRRHLARRPDEALTEAFDGVVARFRERGLLPGRGHTPRALLLDSDDRVAALEGIVEPRVLVSRGLIAHLDRWELEAVLAHELAHFAHGGNLRTLVIWLLRALQAFSPPALVVFRSLIEAREAAADELAAAVTGKPAVLAAALLQLHGGPALPEPGAGAVARARFRVLRRAEIASTRLRIRALLDGEGSLGPPPALTATAGVLLAVLLWGVA